MHDDDWVEKVKNESAVSSQSVLGRKIDFFQITIFYFDHYHKICHQFGRSDFVSIGKELELCIILVKLFG
jgi:hypothetical protein